MNSSTGNITFDVDNDQIFEAHLSSSGLGIGTTPSANLHVQGNGLFTKRLSIGKANLGTSNLHISGTLGTSYDSVSSNVSLENQSTFFADSSSGNLTLTLPEASSVEGRVVTIKKISASNNISIIGGGNVEGASGVNLSSSNLGHLKVISSAGNWWIMSLTHGITYHSNGFSPLQLSPKAWFDASDASSISSNISGVTQWRDKSGNDYHVAPGTEGSKTHTHPSTGTVTINGLNAIDFDGAEDGLINATTRLGFGANPDFMFAAVIYPDASLSASDRFFQLGPAGNGKLALSAGSDGWSWRHNNGAEKYSSITVDFAYVVVFTHPSGGDYASNQFFLNGTEDTATSINNGGNVPTDTSTITYIGTGRSGSGTWPEFDGYIGEIVILESVDPDDRQTLEGYLAHKWGLEGSLPGGHPYKTSAP